MATGRSVGAPTSVLWPLLAACFLSLYVAVSADFHLVVSEFTSLQLVPSLTVQNSPGTKPSTSANCERVQIHGLSRLKGLKKFSHSAKVKVLQANSSIRTSTFEVCFHRNLSLGIGMCPEGQWEKLTRGLWSQIMSPFDHKLLDIRMVGSSKETVEVSIEEEFYLHRVILLVIGITVWTLAPSLSKSLVFYYSGAMAVGVILVILMILFQGMKLLPTGRKNSLGFYLFASIAGVGSYLLRYLPKLLRSALVEIGISKDMYYPLTIFLLVFIFLVGAWLGFWFVHKLVRAGDGSIDISTSRFVAWSIRLLGAIMILQATLDHWLAIEALVCGILISTFLRRVTRLKLFRQLYRSLFRSSRSRRRKSHLPDSPPFEDSHDEYFQELQRPRRSAFLSPRSRPFTLASCDSKQGLTQSPPSQTPGSDTFYSTFHMTPKRRKFTREEWEKFTRDSTKGALESLVSSPDFSKWAASNAERLTLKPNIDSPDTARPRRRWWFLWF